ncbi:response regulator [Gemmata sp. JC717]|uniref:Response regulator n=1 Tax=Gemmata algarum TaxID=2975278 RepID=A0ABU5EXR7_9BACT|nr:response regulator [Gemmata algarum]MDY3552885.1 response regulator [Gemmata algarum]MDY3559262.1 response regulator [Gemmata algarum]
MNKTILIVDDSPTMRQMVGDTLRGAGYAVLEGVNGSDALAKVAGRTVHLVITDFNMPVMGGLVLIERLRAKPEFRFTPILVLTTESETSRKEQGKAAGATGWVTKPFDPVRLVQVVKRLMP